MRRAPTVVGTVVLCAVLALGATAPGVLAQESSGSVTVSAGDATVDVGGQTLVPITLSSAPNGLSGYELTATVDDGSVATVTGGEYPRSFNVTVDPAVANNGVTLEAADSENEIRPGDSSILLGYVAVDAESAGETTVQVSVSDMDDESGADLNPTTASGSVTVSSNDGSAGGASAGGGAAPSDDDSDTPTEGTATPEYTATPTDVSVNTAEGIVTPQPETATPTPDAGGAAPQDDTPSAPSQSSLPIAPLLLGAAALVVVGAGVAIRKVIR